MPETEAPPFAPESPPAGTPESPSPAPPQSLAPEAAPAAPPQEAAPEPGPDATPPEGEPEGTPKEPAAKIWASFENAQAALDHPDVVPHLEERDRAAHERAYSDVQSRMQPILQKNEAHLASIDKGMTGFMNAFNDAVDEGTLDEKTVGKLFRNHADALAGINGQARTMGHEGGVNAALAGLLQQAGASDKIAAFQDRIRKTRDGLSDPTLVEDALKAMVSDEVAKAKERWEKDEGKLVRERVEAQVRNEKRLEQPAPAEPKGGSAGGGKGWKTKAEAATLHVAGKITNTEMRRINSDPTIPE